MNFFLYISPFLNSHYVCPFKAVTGIPCPSCGSTRALLSLLRLDIKQAILYNPGLILGGVLFFVYVIWGARHNIKTGNWPRLKPIYGFRWIVTALFLLNWLYIIVSAG